MNKTIAWGKYGWAICMMTWTILGGAFIVLTRYYPAPGTLFLVAFSVFSATSVLGFLLGMKENKNPTHLQQIADWLTKILIGAGLVEMGNISDSVWEFSNSIGSVIDPSTGSFIVVSIIVGFGAVGAVSGYLWSQLHYGNE
ncbi:MAG: hypothetical protein ACI9LY_002318 [Arenicella sp.]|jgi:hypothetical protein